MSLVTYYKENIVAKRYYGPHLRNAVENFAKVTGNIFHENGDNFYMKINGKSYGIFIDFGELVIRDYGETITHPIVELDFINYPLLTKCLNNINNDKYIFYNLDKKVAENMLLIEELSVYSPEKNASIINPDTTDNLDNIFGGLVSMGVPLTYKGETYNQSCSEDLATRLQNALKRNA